MSMDLITQLAGSDLIGNIFEHVDMKKIKEVGDKFGISMDDIAKFLIELVQADDKSQVLQSTLVKKIVSNPKVLEGLMGAVTTGPLKKKLERLIPGNALELLTNFT